MVKYTMCVKEMSELLGLSRPKCYELLHKEDGIPHIRAGKRILIPIKSFEEWLNSASMK